MNPAWITAIVAVLGLAMNGLWTAVNLRIENRILIRIEALKEWADDRFEPRRNPRVVRLPAPRPSSGEPA